MIQELPLGQPANPYQDGHDTHHSNAPIHNPLRDNLLRSIMLYRSGDAIENTQNRCTNGQLATM